MERAFRSICSGTRHAAPNVECSTREETATIAAFARALLAWILIGIPIVGATSLVLRHQAAVTASLHRERAGVAALDRAYAAGCANVSPRALRAAVDRSGLSDDIGMASLLLDAVMLRWPPGCAHLRTATLRLVRAGNRRDRHTYSQRVLAFTDETLAQVGLLAGAEDEAEGLRAGGIAEDPSVGAI